MAWQLQDVFDRIEIAYAVSTAAKDQFTDPLEMGSDGRVVLSPLTISATRSIILLLETKKITLALQEELEIALPRTPRDINPATDLPSDFREATEVVERFTADAEEAFADLIDRLSNIISSDNRLFWRCIADILRHLSPDNAGNWRLLARSIGKQSPYRHTFVDNRIEEPAATLWLLEDLEVEVGAETAKEWKIESWRAAAIEKLYETAAAIRASDSKPTQGFDESPNEKAIGQAVVRIWAIDDNFKDTRSWFPPAHHFWPLHLPGKPRVASRHDIPKGAVAFVKFLPWTGYGNGDVVAVGMTSGEIRLFRRGETEPLQVYITRISPRILHYTSFALLVRGPEAYRADTPLRRFLILSPTDGKALSGKFITERKPSDDELQGLESLGRWRRDRQLRRLTQCRIPIQEGLVPYPDDHPESFTLSQVSNAFMKGSWVFQQACHDSALQPAEYNAWGQIKTSASTHSGDFYAAHDSSKSRLILHSEFLKSDHGFLVPPGVTHFDIDATTLALAGNGQMYIYQ